MLPASFSLSPNVLVLLHRSEPARSHRENLQRGKFQGPVRSDSVVGDAISAQDTYSESHFTSASSIFSSFMVNMLWLDGELASERHVKKEKPVKTNLPSAGRLVHLRSRRASVFVSKLEQF